MGTVIDGNGAVVGESLSTLPVSITAFIVRIDGGIFFYYPNGTLLPTDTVQGRRMRGHGLRQGQAVRNGGICCSPVRRTRTVYRVGSPTLGPATAYRFDSTSESVTNVQFYSRGSDGVCAASGASTPAIQCRWSRSRRRRIILVRSKSCDARGRSAVRLRLEALSAT